MDEKFRLNIFLLIIFFMSGCSTTQPTAILNTVSDHKQVLIVSPMRQNHFYGLLSAWERHDQEWKRVGLFSVVLGRNGMAPLNMKQEGDGQTPSGRYPIGVAFGYDSKISTKLDYSQLTDQDFWVDDPSSTQYNQWIHGKPQANSFEHMKREDNLYRLGAVIKYNTDPIVPGKGSAIFLHIWRAYYKPTAGCVALSQRNIRKLLQWLDKDKNPIIILVQK